MFLSIVGCSLMQTFLVSFRANSSDFNFSFFSFLPFFSFMNASCVKVLVDTSDQMQLCDQ